MTSHARRLSSERGSILVQVGVAIIVLIAFTTFVADYGLLWVSRRQAQNAADAGALAGAVAFAYEDPGDYSDTGGAKRNAYAATQQNPVWGQLPSVNITTHITCPVVPAADCDP